jgi:penicillin-binding protein 2
VYRFGIIIVFFIAIVTGCRPQVAHQVAALPTLQASPTSPADLEAAERVARLYLDAWEIQNFDEMHRLLTFRNQESTPLDRFKEIYDIAQSTMTFERLDYTATSLLREGVRIVVLHYDITIQTRILGSFTDSDRELTLVIDPQIGEWRVAWSLGDIFAEMGDGATLVFDPQIPSRANIYDRNGEVLADQNGRVVRVLVSNADIPDRNACFQILSETVNKPLEEIIDLFDRRSGVNWEVDAGVMEPTVFIERNVEVESVCNAEFKQQATRRYLRGSLMPHIIGHVGYPDEAEIDELESIGFNSETIIGKSGIEANWNDTLAGKPGGRLTLVSQGGTRLRVLTEVRSQIPESIWLTINSDLQEYVLQVLGEAYLENSGSWGRTSNGSSVVIMDVNTGELLSLASYPTFEGNAQNPFPAVGREVADLVLERLAEDDRVPQLNRPTQGVYPTGSVMKVMTSIAALESGVYDEDTSIFCSGVWNHENDFRYDWLAGGHGRMTVQSAITNSCNPFYYEAGFRLNDKDPYLLSSYAQLMGLGEYTGLRDIAEAQGNIPTPDNVLQTSGLPWSYAFAVNLSIGQGEVQASPLQMARMYAAVANGGDLLRPQLVYQRGILDQRTSVAEQDIMRDTEISPENIKIIHAGMCDVTKTRTGTASHIFRDSPLLDIGVCGKTGTAQATGDGVPPHSWFIAFAPEDDPQIAIVTMIENAGDGSAIAAPITRRILEYFYFGPFD